MSVTLGFIHPNVVTAGFMQSVLQVAPHPYLDQVIMERGGPAELGQARDRLVHKFLQGSKSDYLWFVDTDIIFKPGALDRLLGWGKGVVSANYSLVHEVPATYDWKTRECAYAWTDRDTMMGLKHYDELDGPNGLAKVDACGAGCLLIRRSVLEHMGEPWFEEFPGYGEDISFCKRLAEKALPLFYDTGLKVLHQKTVWV